jgi:3',5'-cyclic-AMP phosphodiesterase
LGTQHPPDTEQDIMPIYLPPISRRQFLAGALAAGASLPLLSFGEETEGSKTPNSSRYLLISDVHVGAHFESKKHGVKPAVQFSHAIDQILAMKDRPKRVIAAGDYAISRGNHDNCKMFRKLTHRFSEAGMSCRFALGNHDSRKVFLDEFPRAKELIDPHAESLGRYVHVMETLHANWFFLDSLHEQDINLGVLGQPQLKWLANALDARPDKPAMIVGHHNPSLKNPKRDTAAFYDVIVPRKQVKAYIFGHTHCWKLDHHEGIHLVNIPTVSAWKESDQPRGFLTTDLHKNGMTLALHTLGHAERKEHELKWRKA